MARFFKLAGLLVVSVVLVVEGLPLQEDLLLPKTKNSQVLVNQTEGNADLSGLIKRPIYNVAHMVNGNDQLNAGWVDYANAIESDLEFNSDGSPRYFYHGIPCDCFRSCTYEGNVIKHFQVLRSKAEDTSENFALFWIDLKLTKSKVVNLRSAGTKLAQVMTRSDSLFPPGRTVPVYVLLGVEAKDQVDFFRGFREHIWAARPDLKQRFGYDISDTGSSIDHLLNAFHSVSIHDNIWMGDGITNCLPRSNDRLKTILARRDSGKGPHKVYAWTADRTSTMKTWLELGVDAAIVNYPNRLKSLVTNDFRNSLVLATRATNPWERIKKSEAVPPNPQ